MLLPAHRAVLIGGSRALMRRNCVAAFDAYSGITAAGGFASGWSDKYGAGYILAQATGAAQPAVTENSNGPCLRFDGAANFMDMALTLPQPFTLMMVLRQLSWTGNDTILDRLTGGPTTFAALYQTGVTPQVAQYCTSNGAITSQLVLGVTGVLTAVFNGAASSIKVNLATKSAGNPGTTGLDGITLGARNDQANFGHIDVHALRIYRGAVSDAVQDASHALLMAKWGVLPS